jgi:O-antigen ligase
MDIRSIIQRVISWLPVVGLLMLVAVLPFHYNWCQRFAWYWLAITYPLDYVVNCRWKNWHWTNSKWAFVAFIAFALLVPLWQLFDPLHTDLFRTTLENVAPLFVLGLVGILGVTDKMRLDYVAWTMLTVSLGIIAYLVYIVGLSMPSLPSWIFSFNEHRMLDINSHMVINLYWNMTLVVGLWIVLRSGRSLTAKILTAAMMLPIVLALLISEGRTGIITLLMATLIVLLYLLITHRNWWLLLPLALYVGAAFVYVGNNKRMEAARTQKNPRVYLWQVARETIAERPVVGYGVCSARKEFVSRVRENEYLAAMYVRPDIEENPLCHRDGDILYEMIHPHNAVLETWMRFGAIGLLLFFACLILPMTMHLDGYQLYMDLCVLAFSLQAVFESLGNNLQPLFLCLMTLLIYSSYHAEQAQQSLPN